MQNAIFKLKARFKFSETASFDPVSDLEAEYFVVDPNEEDGLPSTFEINSIDFEKLAEFPPELENWSEEESILHSMFGHSEQTLISQDWHVLCQLSLAQDCDLRLVGILLRPKPGTSIEPTFSYEIGSQTIL